MADISAASMNTRTYYQSRTNYQSKSLWWVSSSLSFITWQTWTSYNLGQDSAECASPAFKICLSANITNWIIVLCHSVKLSQLLYPYENSDVVESDKNCDVSCKSRTVCLFDDDHLDEKKGIKPYLQTLYLQNELIILSFLFKRMLSNKICFEFWARHQRL